MQCDDTVVYTLETGQMVNHRFRTCGRCLTSMPLGDRMYHCTNDDVHYPLYDHYCYWLRLTVFLHTIKPYLIVCGALTMDALFVFTVSVYAATTRASTRQHVAAALASFVLFAALSFQVTIRQWAYLAFQNCTGPEMGKETFFMVRWLDERRVEVLGLPVQSGKGPRHPWQLSWSENLRETLGESVGSWFSFWRVPEGVLRWEADEGEGSDFRLGRLWHEYTEGRLVPWTWQYENPRVLDRLTAEEDDRTSSLPFSWTGRRRGARSTGVDFEML